MPVPNPLPASEFSSAGEKAKKNTVENEKRKRAVEAQKKMKESEEGQKKDKGGLQRHNPHHTMPAPSLDLQAPAPILCSTNGHLYPAVHHKIGTPTTPSRRSQTHVCQAHRDQGRGVNARHHEQITARRGLKLAQRIGLRRQEEQRKVAPSEREGELVKRVLQQQRGGPAKQLAGGLQQRRLLPQAQSTQTQQSFYPTDGLYQQHSLPQAKSTQTHQPIYPADGYQQHHAPQYQYQQQHDALHPFTSTATPTDPLGGFQWDWGHDVFY
jgi:hypothetical protein